MRTPEEQFALWSSRHSAKVLAFYIGAPVLLACFAAIGSGYEDTIGYDGAFVYLLLVALPSWWLVSGFTQLVKLVLRPWRPSLWVLTALGALLSGWPIFLYVVWFTDVFHRAWPGGEQMIWPWPSNPQQAFDLALRTIRGGLVWIAVNVLFDRFFGLPRFRYSVPPPADFAFPAAHSADAAHPSSSETVTETANSSAPPPAGRREETPPAPALLDRLTMARRLDDILAIKAEEHYVRVYTPAGEEMRLCRFSDAIADMDSRIGLRVHRSYWVNLSAVERVERQNGRWEILLTNGVRIPVSQRYHEVVKQVIG